MGSQKIILGHNSKLWIFFEYNVYSGCLFCGLERYIEGYKSLVYFVQRIRFVLKEVHFQQLAVFSSHLQEDSFLVWFSYIPSSWINDFYQYVVCVRSLRFDTFSGLHINTTYVLYQLNTVFLDPCSQLFTVYFVHFSAVHKLNPDLI